jgi:arsenate reductase-like glutaredoxin family protein
LPGAIEQKQVKIGSRNPGQDRLKEWLKKVERKTEGLMKTAAHLEETISHGAEKRLRPRVDSGWLACYTRAVD